MKNVPPSIDLIVGLGNPGADYCHTRHNAGAWFVEELARRFNGRLTAEKKFHGLVGRIRIAGREVRLLVPTTFMNLSGQSVVALARFYRVDPATLLIAHDEIDIPAGEGRFKMGGGHGGHNGLRDIIGRLGGHRDFCRLRVGVGRPDTRVAVTDHVLAKPGRDEARKIDDVIQLAADLLPQAMAGQWAGAVQQLHSFRA